MGASYQEHDLENNLLDAQIYRDELAATLIPLVLEYRDSRRMVRTARARLQRFRFERFVEAIESTYGPTVLEQVLAECRVQ